jgi:hypothetical protein
MTSVRWLDGETTKFFHMILTKKPEIANAVTYYPSVDEIRNDSSHRTSSRISKTL